MWSSSMPAVWQILILSMPNVVYFVCLQNLKKAFIVWPSFSFHTRTIFFLDQIYFRIAEIVRGNSSVLWASLSVLHSNRWVRGSAANWRRLWQLQNFVFVIKSLLLNYRKMCERNYFKIPPLTLNYIIFWKGSVF